VMQDIRSLVLYADLPPNRITAASAFGTPAGRLIPIAVTFAVLGLGIYLFKRDEPWLAERV
jgi:hypothetical protein